MPAIMNEDDARFAQQALEPSTFFKDEAHDWSSHALTANICITHSRHIFSRVCFRLMKAS